MNRSTERPGPISVDVCVCTFRRPQLAETIRSVAALHVSDDVTVRILVADNDTDASAQDIVERLRRDTPLEILYVHAPASNISVARNACLDNSAGDYIAFLDDDETASPEWLEALLEQAAATGADVVLGPVKASYDQTAPKWMRRGDFHSTFPVWVRGVIRTGYTCNVLLRRSSPTVAGRRFDLALGRSGGEDTDFFTGLHDAGGTIVYAPQAWVHETVPENRAKLSWLAKRRFRMGQTHGRLTGERRSIPGRIAQWGLAAAKAGYCFTAAACLVAVPHRRNACVLRGVLHTGVMSGLVGIREIRQYGEALPGEASSHAT